MVLDTLVSEGGKLILSTGLSGAFVIILGVVSVFLFKSLQDCQNARISESERLATALERQANSNATAAAAIETRTKILEEVAKLVAELGRQSSYIEKQQDAILRRLEDKS